LALQQIKYFTSEKENENEKEKGKKEEKIFNIIFTKTVQE
jgi:hypothetical protein